MWRIVFLLALAAALPAAEKYTGPRPPKPDLIYIVHASNLVPTEQAEATEGKKKDDTIYTVSGAESPAKTPVAEPIFILESKSLSPERVQLYRMEVKNGQREIVFPPPGKRRKDAPRPMHLSLRRLGDGLYRIEANEFLPNGEYALSPEGSNTVFCFQVY
ncbi:MAG: hypothetical protein IANPNBLG_03643 [Bryobacteraceae bacterium]|nr:hypothetical protein [Bryobacteraceae bacterium]MCC6341499.1 hypothetical protein [Bryobacterales bacterium]